MYPVPVDQDDVGFEDLSRREQAVALALHLLVLPGVLLLALFALGRLVGVSFGDLVILLTVLMTVMLVTAQGWGQRAAAGSRVGVLFQRADQVYISDVSEGRTFEIPTVTRVVAVLLAATALGWVILLASYLGYLPHL